MRHVALLLWLPLVLAGCDLIDQRTFESKTVAPPPSALQALAAGNQRPSLPLVTIPLGDLDGSWSPILVAAERQAVARKPDVQFDVVTLRPTDPALEGDPAIAKSLDSAAQAVAGVLLADEVPAERVHLGVRGDAGRPPPEVLVFVR